MEIEKFRVDATSSVVQAIAAIDRGGAGVVAIVDSDGILVGIITDGDIRRAILQHFDLNRSVIDLQKSQAREFGPKPLSLPVNATRAQMIAFFDQYKIRHLPLIDPRGRLVKMVMHEELLGPSAPQTRGVIMAGGFGTRLRPLTESTPKPMLELGGKPILQRLVEQFRMHGVTQITLILHYKKEVFQDFFGDGSRLGVEIDYVIEAKPCGTAGAISHLTFNDRLLFIANGDIVTGINFELMERFHREHNANLTIAVAPYDTIIPYGVVEMEEPRVLSVTEKPRSRHFVNAGLYLISPKLCQMIPKNRVYNMTDLIKDAVADGETVLGFPVREYWRDIGQHDDYRQAELDLAASE